MALQETLDDTEEVVGEASDGTRLVYGDDGTGAVLEQYDDPDYGTVYERTEHDREKDALLHFRLWVRVNGFHRPESPSRSVPVEIATAGKPEIAAWLYLRGATGHTGTRAGVAEYMDVTEHTVSRYLSRVRNDE